MCKIHSISMPRLKFFIKQQSRETTFTAHATNSAIKPTAAVGHKPEAVLGFKSSVPAVDWPQHSDEHFRQYSL